MSQHDEKRVAEAAAWMAHLHGARRSPDSDRGHQLWLREDAARRKTWEAATEVWEEVGLLQSVALEKGIRAILPEPARPRAPRVHRLARAAVVAVLMLGALSIWMSRRDISTSIGEQRVVSLDDGSRVTLNTDSRIEVSYDAQVRKIELKNGEARFDVAQQSRRPFVVVAGNKRIDALGTSFIVRHEAHRTEVMLVEGKVRVASSDAATVRAGAQRGTAADVVLRPGQRLTFVSDRLPKLDSPALDTVTAWQRGEVLMDGMKLSDAIIEMNRYSDRQLAVASESANDLVVSGVFQSGDSLRFARAVAHTYRLRVIEEGDRILLSGQPKAAYR
jgi:transmembrane sensor